MGSRCNDVINMSCNYVLSNYNAYNVCTMHIYSLYTMSMYCIKRSVNINPNVTMNALVIMHDINFQVAGCHMVADFLLISYPH